MDRKGWFDVRHASTPAFFVSPAMHSPPPTAALLDPLDAWIMRVSNVSSHLATHPFWHSTLPGLCASHSGIRLALGAVDAMAHVQATGCDAAAHHSALQTYYVDPYRTASELHPTLSKLIIATENQLPRKESKEQY